MSEWPIAEGGWKRAEPPYWDRKVRKPHLPHPMRGYRGETDAELGGGKEENVTRASPESPAVEQTTWRER